VPVLKIKCFSGDSRTKLEKQIDIWLAKQPGKMLVQRTEVAPTSRTVRTERPIILVTVWSEQQESIA
jgi:hypothetical protein